MGFVMIHPSMKKIFFRRSFGRVLFGATSHNMPDMRHYSSLFVMCTILLVSGASPCAPSPALPKIASAPEFAGISHWYNSPPLTLKALKGKVVLVDFWTYSCINCLNTLPHIKEWYSKYKDKGFVVVGVHSPEFEFEKDNRNILKAIERFKILYPVALDANYKTWDAYNNHAWPAHYLIDQAGFIRDVHIGEGAYDETENAIRALLGEKPMELSGREPSPFRRILTPETYLGYLRAQAYGSAIQIKSGEARAYRGTPTPSSNEVNLQGTWLVGPESATAKSKGAHLYLNFLATKVYLVMSGSSKSPVTLTLDGKPLPKEFYTEDMNEKGEIWIKDARKYDVINLKKNYGRHVLGLQLPEEVSAYAFTFGDE
jgi:thiol-disulfide isomerase/thioredoxin